LKITDPIFVTLALKTQFL